MSTRTIAVVSGGLSQPSSTRLLADRLAEAAAEGLRGQGIAPEVQVVELREYARDLADNLVTGFANEHLREAIERVTSADGLIAVTPVFSASYSGLFKAFFDVLDPDALRGRPVLLGATAGTARHSLVLEHAMRPLFSYLHALAVPTAVFAASEDWATGRTGVSGALADRIERAGGELADLVATRAPAATGDPFGDVVPFDRLLTGS
jgi:FMN reductase